jgi:hypothetical protein
MVERGTVFFVPLSFEFQIPIYSVKIEYFIYMRFPKLFFSLWLSLATQLSWSQSDSYTTLQKKICTGWNTWSYGSMLSHVLLPEGLVLKVNLRQSFIGTPGDPQYFLGEFNTDTSRLVLPIAHTFDGKYTELIINNWKGNSLRVQSAAIGKDIVILITPIKKSPDIHFNIELESGIMWNKEGNIKRTGKTITARFKESEYIVRSTSADIEAYQSYTSPYLVFKGDSTIGIYTGEEKTLTEIITIIDNAKNEYHSYAKKYGKLADGFEAIQSVLGWNTIYDAKNNRAITPVTRSWNEAWQGYVLFEWDTYFASILCALDNKELAYSNAIAVTKGINTDGYVGQWQMPGMKALSISQPPVGSLACWMIYKKFSEKWFLEEVYNELLSWNRWWIKNRLYKNYLTWGCNKGGGHQMAAWESGLDNSPMYDEVKMVDVGDNSLFDVADVGLNSLYAADCKYLSLIALELGKINDANELTARAEQYSWVTRMLWDDKSGFFLNWFPERKVFSPRLSPAMFYPMIANIPNASQSQRMLKEHFYNSQEFYGKYMLPSCPFNDKSYNNNYWRGAVWGPMNFLVYLGLANYDQKAAKELSEKSYDMFITAWLKNGTVLENTNSLKGPGNLKDQVNFAPYYHWGALMGIMEFMQAGMY